MRIVISSDESLLKDISVGELKALEKGDLVVWTTFLTRFAVNDDDSPVDAQQAETFVDQMSLFDMLIKTREIKEALSAVALPLMKRKL